MDGSSSGVRSRKRRPRTLVGGFYDSVLSEAERAHLARARRVAGLDEEIAVLRLRLRGALEAHPEELALMIRGIDLLVKALSARYRMTKDDKAEVADSIRAALEEFEARASGKEDGDGAGEEPD